MQQELENYKCYIAKDGTACKAASPLACKRIQIKGDNEEVKGHFHHFSCVMGGV